MAAQGKRGWGRRIMRGAGWAGFGLVALLLILYVAFLGFLELTERGWFGSPPPTAAMDVSSNAPHEFTLIDGGAESLTARLQMIRSAEKTLDLEFFIYELDQASRIITQEIAERARAGVRVRVLVDFSLAVFELRPRYARELAQAGVEVRYYNTASAAQLFRVQHRTHRKLLIADARVAMLGGRNIADDYFDLSPRYNFLDSDVMVAGEIVTAIQRSFDAYWDSELSELPEATASEHVDGAARLLSSRPEDADVVRAASQVMPGQAFTCPRVRFVTDYPGAGVQHRRVYRAINEVLAGAQHTVIAESPYLVLRDDGIRDTRALTERGVKVEILTNSLASTDAYYTVGPLWFSLDDLPRRNLNLWAYTGLPPADPAWATAPRWGVHSKRAVVDADTILIGTYNLDSRSANFNSELIVVCEGSVALATEMRNDIRARMAKARLVAGNGDVFHDNLIGGASPGQVALMFAVSPIAVLFDLLL